MTLLPRELARPFQSETERANAWRQLAERDRLLRAIEDLANKPATAWSPTELSAFPHVTNGVPDPPPQRISRWVRIFAEELAEVHRLIARQLLSDIELQETLYLAGRLLATVTDLPIEEVEYFRLG